MIFCVGLSESGDVQCQKYSGGMKRRLSVAMAMIGDPPLLLLDEPVSYFIIFAKKPAKLCFHQSYLIVDKRSGSGIPSSVLESVGIS